MSEPIVAFEGPRGTSHERALKLIKTLGNFESVPMFSSSNVLQSVFSVPDLFGIIPIESSIEGLRISILDQLAFETTKVLACEEVVLAEKIEGFSLVGEPPIDTVISHPQIIELCQEFIQQNGLKVQYATSTDMACAEVVSKRVPSIMALAPTAVGQRYGLKPFFNGIFGDPEVRTRYLLVGHGVGKATASDRSLLLVIPAADQTGTLAMISKIFAMHKTNMQSIISRPLADAIGKHAFYISCDGHISSNSLQSVIKDLINQGSMVKPLGSFPLWNGPEVTSPFSTAPEDSLKQERQSFEPFVSPVVIAEN